MRAVIKQLHMPKGYKPEKFSNPALQWHYRILQAIALDEEQPDKPEDHTRPKYRLIRKHAAKQVLRWGEELEEAWKADWEQPEPAVKEVKGRKRHMADDEGDEGVKPPRKKRAGADEVQDEEMRRAHEREQVQKFTVVQLKSWLASKGLETGGRKGDLVDRVDKWFEN